MTSFHVERTAPAEADVIVVGGGGSGLAAAISAAEAGASVILLEKNVSLGGTTRLSIGSFSAADTSMQREGGIDDSPERFLEDLAIANAELEARENETLREAFVGEAAESFEWLRSLGLQFFGPTEEPPFTRPRMHNVLPNARAYIVTMGRAARRAGVVIRTGFRASALLRDGSGRVVGVDGPSRIFASAGVILATGDYSASEDLRRRWVSKERTLLPAINPASTGDGFTMAIEVGARVLNSDRALEELRLPPPARPGIDITRWLPSSGPVPRLVRLAVERLPRAITARVARAALTGHVAPSAPLLGAGGILVNTRGTRFTNEEGPAAHALTRELHNACYVLFDARIARRFAEWPHPLSTFPGVAYAYLRDYERLRPDVTHRAGNLAGLASAVDLDPSALQATVDRYNAHVARGSDRDWQRQELGEGLHEAPFYALGPLSGFMTLTDGGLAIDIDCRVIGADREAIQGLFAVGSTGQGGLILKNHGLHIAWAMTSGRIAGRAAARGPRRSEPAPATRAADLNTKEKDHMRDIVRNNR